MMILRLTAAILLSCVAGAPAFAQESASESGLWGRPDVEKGALTLTGENDSLSSGADRNYTSGVKLTYVSPVNVMPKWARQLDGLTRALTNTRPSFWGVAVGQSLFTPEDIETAEPLPDQHPYAGWLYGQILVAAEENVIARQPRYVDLYELEFGMVGPSAQGKQSQRGIHELLGAPDPKGWDNQLKDEFAFAATLERRWRAERVLDARSGLQADVAPGVAVTLGTLRTEAKAGASLRVGTNLANDYGAPRVRPGLGGVGYFGGGSAFSWYGFAGVDLRAVARNLFLDGNTYRDSPSVEKRPFVADVQVGVAAQTGDWRLAYTYVTRTKEFETQREQQDFGALSLSWRF